MFIESRPACTPSRTLDVAEAESAQISTVPETVPARLGTEPTVPWSEDRFEAAPGSAVGPRAPSATDRLVDRAFQDIVGRSVQAGFWNDWAAGEAARGVPLDVVNTELRAHLAASTEAQVRQARRMVDDAHEELLGRRTDGVGFWHDAAAAIVARGGSLDDARAHVARGIRASEEYQALHPDEVSSRTVEGNELSARVMERASEVAQQINGTGGYRFDGRNDCWGFVRRVHDPLRQERGLPPLPTGDAGTAAGRRDWQPITDWSQIPVGTPLSTARGHAWGDQWHGGIFAGVKDGVPMIYDNSGARSAQLRRLPHENYFSYYHVPSAELLR